MILPPLQCVWATFSPTRHRDGWRFSRQDTKSRASVREWKEFGHFNGAPSDLVTNQRTFGSGFSATPALRNAFEAGRARDRGRPELMRTFIPLHPLSSLADVNKAWHNQRPCDPSPQSIKGEGSVSLVEAVLLNQTDKIPKSSQRIEELRRMQLKPRQIWFHFYIPLGLQINFQFSLKLFF